MQQQIKKGEDSKPNSRSYSTLARRPIAPSKPSARSFSTTRRLPISAEQEYSVSERPSWQPLPPQARAQEEAEEEVDEEFDDDGDYEYEPNDDEMSGVVAQGHKFGIPPKTLPPQSHLRKRYDPLVEQVTNLIMRHGKKATAQKVCR